MIGPKAAAAAGDAERLFSQRAACAVMQDQRGRAAGAPGHGGRIDQMTQRIDFTARDLSVREPREDPGGEAGRPVVVTLRFVLVNRRRVEDVRAEYGLGDMAAQPLFKPAERVQPAVGGAAALKIIEQFQMAVARGQADLRFCKPLVDREAQAFAAPDAPEIAACFYLPARVDQFGPERQFLLRAGHGRWQGMSFKLCQRRHGQRHDVALAHERAEFWDEGVRRKVRALHVRMRDAPARAIPLPDDGFIDAGARSAGPRESPVARATLPPAQARPHPADKSQRARSRFAARRPGRRPCG